MQDQGRGKLLGPWTVYAACVGSLELIALGLWPTLYLADSSLAPSPFGEMVRRRVPYLDSMVDWAKSAIDWLFPGALWTWEQLVTFFLHSVVVAFMVYAVAAWTLARRRPTWAGLPWILGPMVLFQLTLLFTPATLTTDVYNYAIYGEMPVVYGANPFLHAPRDFPQSALFYLIPTYWHDAPSVYGPLWVALSAGVASLLQGKPLIDELLAYRAIANAAHVANTVLVWLIAQRLRSSAAPSAALAYGWNPLALIEFALNGHNDVLMLTFVLAALLAGLSDRFRLAALLLGCSIAVKYTTVLLVPLFLVWLGMEEARRAGAPHRPRDVLTSPIGLRRLALGGGSAFGLVLLLYLPWVQGVETLGPVLYWITGPRLQNYWPEPLLISLTAWTAGALGTSYEAVWAPLLAGFKQVGRLALVAVILWEVWRMRSVTDLLIGSVRVWLVFLLLVNTWIMPWYYTWPLALVAALGWQSTALRICVGLTLTAPMVMYGRQLGFAPVQEWAGVSLVFPLILAGLAEVAAWLRMGRARSQARGRYP